jgi:predicted transcriptional regulator
VEAEPGIHVSELADRVGLSWRTTAYHLGVLQRSRLIHVDKQSRERRAFPAGIPPRHRQWLAAVRLDHATDVLRLLLADPRQSVPALSRRMGYSEKVVRRHLTNLAEAGLVERQGTLRPLYGIDRSAAPTLVQWLRGDDRGGALQPLGDGLDPRRDD